MAKIIGVHFLPKGKLFYCDADDTSLHFGDYVVLDTGHGLGLAKVVVPEAQVQQSEQLMTVVRRAKTEDLEKAQQDQENEALTKCNEMVAKLGLKMKPLAAHYDLNHGHLTIFFSARERVDFRGLVWKLSRSLEMRVELRLVGPRDEAKLVGCIGKCGYPLCCQSFITDFPSVSIKMAKEQDLALSPIKISGICGRLLCCLGYESKQYANIKEKMPQEGKEISTPFGRGMVISNNLLKELVVIKLVDSHEVKEIPLNQLNYH